MTRHPYTVRKMTSGRDGSVSYYVYSLKSHGRVSVHASTIRQSAQIEADKLNIGAMVKNYEDDPRPYDVRYAEAEIAYRTTVAK